MKHILVYINLFFIACIMAGASACSDDTTIINNCTPVVINDTLFKCESFEIVTSETGIVNISNYMEWLPSTVDSNVIISFDGQVNGLAYGDVKYILVQTWYNNSLSFDYSKYNAEITGHHSFLIVDTFDMVNFYIKIFNNYSAPAYIRLTNITITKL